MGKISLVAELLAALRTAGKIFNNEYLSLFLVS
jgi:hypothetical protein